MFTHNKANQRGQSSAAFELRIPFGHDCAIQTLLRPAGYWRRLCVIGDDCGKLMSAYFAALVFGFFIAVVAIFQLALAVGVPWGSVAMAGKFPGRFPPPMRAVAFVQTFVLIFLGAIVWTRAGIIFPQWYFASEKFIWGVVAFGILGFIMNLITPIKWERIIWAPVAAILLISSMIVAMS